MQIYMYLQGRQTDTGSFFFAPSQKLGHILAQIHPKSQGFLSFIVPRAMIRLFWRPCV